MIEELQSPVKEYMTAEPTCVKLSTSLQKSLGYIRIKRFRHMIIVDDNKKCIGIFSIKDAFDFLCDAAFAPK